MKLLIVIALLFTLPVFGQTDDYKALLAKYYSDFPTISVYNAKAKVGQDKVYFLDTREKAEFNVSHIKNARNVGFDNFKMSSVANIPKDAEIIVYCSIGARSQTIGERLKKAGYTNVKNLYGGLFHWCNSGAPMVNNSNVVTTRIHGFSTEWGKWINKGTVVYK